MKGCYGRLGVGGPWPHNASFTLKNFVFDID